MATGSRHDARLRRHWATPVALHQEVPHAVAPSVPVLHSALTHCDCHTRAARTTGSLPVPSFAAENQRLNKGVQFGHRLKSRREVELALGYPAGPGPGGLLPVPSFVSDNKRLGKGVQFGHRLKTRREIEARLGYPSGPAPGGECCNTAVKAATASKANAQPLTRLLFDVAGNLPVPSFARDNKSLGKGVIFGNRLKTRREIEAKLGYPSGPAPGGMVHTSLQCVRVPVYTCTTD